MKKIVFLVFCVCLAFGFTTCDNGTTGGGSEDYYEGPYNSGEYNRIRQVSINGAFQDELDNYRFIMDEDLLGEWEVVDYIEYFRGIEGFNPRLSSPRGTTRTFLPNGTVIVTWPHQGGFQETWGWTRGYIISGFTYHAVYNPQQKATVASSYTKARLGGNHYLFVQNKDGVYARTGQEPGYTVLVKRSSFSGSNALYNNVLQAQSAAEKEFAQWSGVQSKERGLSNMRVPFRIMWLVYTNGTYGGRSYRMSDATLERFKSSIAELETTVERLTNNNVDIINEYRVIDRLVEGTCEQANPIHVGISPRTAKPEMDLYAPIGEINFVYTVSAIPNPNTGGPYQSIYSGQGFASSGAEGLADGIAHMHFLHEILHAFEFRSARPVNIEMPLLHISCCEFPVGYENYQPGRAWSDNRSGDLNGTKGELFLTANVRYTDPRTNAVSYVGLYPSIFTYVAAWHKYLADMRTVAIPYNEPPAPPPAWPPASGTILGLSYNAKLEHTGYGGGKVISYVVSHTYREALEILTKGIGQPTWEQVGLQGDGTMHPSDIMGKVIFQDCGDDGYRLVYVKANGETEGVGWRK